MTSISTTLLLQSTFWYDTFLFGTEYFYIVVLEVKKVLLPSLPVRQAAGLQTWKIMFHHLTQLNGSFNVQHWNITQSEGSSSSCLKVLFSPAMVPLRASKGLDLLVILEEVLLLTDWRRVPSIYALLDEGKTSSRTFIVWKALSSSSFYIEKFTHDPTNISWQNKVWTPAIQWKQMKTVWYCQKLRKRLVSGPWAEIYSSD